VVDRLAHDIYRLIGCALAHVPQQAIHHCTGIAPDQPQRRIPLGGGGAQIQTRLVARQRRGQRVLDSGG
jgi:hypothetical protein